MGMGITRRWPCIRTADQPNSPNHTNTIQGGGKEEVGKRFGGDTKEHILTLHTRELLRCVDIERRREYTLAMMHICADHLKQRQLQSIRAFRPYTQVREDEETGVSCLTSFR